MEKYFKDYIWKDGLPYGIQEGIKTEGLTYKIVMDPYKKRTSIETYLEGLFTGIVYDSALLNFRHLNPAEQMAWQKEELNDGRMLIRNQDDRIVFIENYCFEDNLCRECHIFSPQGVFLGKNRMYYEKLGDIFNGAVLYDCNNHPVMYKQYELDKETGEFAELLLEEKDMEKGNFPWLK